MIAYRADPTVYTDQSIKKIVTIFIVVFFLLVHHAWSSPRDGVRTFVGGATKSWSSKGHAKAKGFNIKISYPQNWVAKEGTRPNIMQKFVAPSGKYMVGLMASPMAPPFNRKLSVDEKKELLSKDVVREIIGFNFLSYKLTQIDGEVAAMVEYEHIGERVGFKVGQKVLAFIIHQNTSLLFIQCSTSGDASKGMQDIRGRYESAKPLFLLIGGSCVFMDKWKR